MELAKECERNRQEKTAIERAARVRPLHLILIGGAFAHFGNAFKRRHILDMITIFIKLIIQKS